MLIFMSGGFLFFSGVLTNLMGRGIIKPLRSQESEVYKAHKNLKNAGVYIRILRV
jgi:hypothetical protein